METEEPTDENEYCNITPLLLAAWLPARLVTPCFQNVRATKRDMTAGKVQSSAVLCGDKQVCGLASERRAMTVCVCIRCGAV